MPNFTDHKNQEWLKITFGLPISVNRRFTNNFYFEEYIQASDQNGKINCGQAKEIK